MSNQLKLYQFAISHYCEKARWALEHKQLDYQVINLLPGMHVKTVKKIAARSMVPVLTHGEQIVQGSTEIISYLDQTFKPSPLTPTQDHERRETEYWEALADKQIGPHVRRVCYHILLEHRKAVVPRLAEGGPWYGKILLSRVFPKLRERMQVILKINEETVKESFAQIDNAIDMISKRLEQRKYLATDSFSRADLAVAALLGPLCRPQQFEKPGYVMPQAFAALRQRYTERLPWVGQIYLQHR